MHTKVKICGITNLEDALIAAECGADLLGFIFTHSKRKIQPEKARMIINEVNDLVTTVGVFMDNPLRQIKEIAEFTGINQIQLHGKESPGFCLKMNKPVIKRIHVADHDTTKSLIRKMKPYTVSTFLLDPGTGSGKTFNWHIARDIGLPLIIAGGLNPDNVSDVVRILHPYGVDVSSGVETTIGKKDPEKVKRFIEEIK